MPEWCWAADRVAEPILVSPKDLGSVLSIDQKISEQDSDIIASAWQSAGYRPTPTIIEAAETLYRSHDVTEISRSDAGTTNLRATSNRISSIIERSKQVSTKAICFITGVPGAGKTLAGLNIAATRAGRNEDEHAVFLSGNGPLVDVLREALARDQVARAGIRKGDANRAVRRFIQNIHHFRDYYVGNDEVPFEKVAIFDEAQRAWTRKQTSRFMKTKRGHHDFDMSEPEFLIRVMDRHKDWCTVVCLIGGGQEINTGEAGLAEWLTALKDQFPEWEVHASDLLGDRHYTVDENAANMLREPHIQKHLDLHLSVSMRSYRAEQLSAFVSQVLDGDAAEATTTYTALVHRYPIVVTRDLTLARN